MKRQNSHKLSDRVDKIKLYAHSYAFSLNFKYGDFEVSDLLDFASQENLDGIDIDIDDGKHRSLRLASDKELEKVRLYAKQLNLGINLDISSTTKKDVDDAVHIAKNLKVKNIRVYTRYSGHISEIIKKAVSDLKYIAKIAEDHDLEFTIEQHEILKSSELVEIIKMVDNKRIGLLFDFGNMISAGEDPLKALKIMSPYIKQAHLKGVRRVKKGVGYERVGVLQGEGDLPQKEMIVHLLMLGDLKPQIEMFGLEQEVGYRSPPFRSDHEGDDPKIPKRKPSNTPLNKDISIEENLHLERQNAHHQVQYVKNMLGQIKTMEQR